MKVQITITVIGLLLIGIGAYVTWEHIIVAEFLTQIVAGAILSTPFIVIWGVKPLIEKYHNSKSKPKKQYDIKKLNETVFKKLMRVAQSSHPFFFTHEIGFVIPNNKEEFYNKESNEYFYWLNRHLGDAHEDRYSKIEKVIPNLKIGENYLKEMYPDVFNEWFKIKQTVEDYNKKYHNCVTSFAKQAERKIVLEFSGFHTNEKDNYENYTDFYYFKNIGNFIIESIDSGRNTDNVELKIEKSLISKDYWIIYVRKPNYNLMGSHDKNKFDIDKLQKILTDIIKEPSNTIQYQKSREINFIKLNKQIDKFCDNLEKNVVNDIDAQIISSNTHS